MSPRERLQDRRERIPVDFEFNGHQFIGGAGLYPDGRIGELFLNAGKTGTHLSITMQDCAIAASLALQYGCPLEVLRHAMLRDDDGIAAGPLGHLLDRIWEIAK